MKKTVIINLLIGLCVLYLNSCQDRSGLYFVYVKSDDTLDAVQISYSPTVESNKSENTTLPHYKPVTCMIKTDGSYKVKVSVSRLNNQGLIRGLIWQQDQVYDTAVVNGDTIFDPAIVFANQQITTSDSLLDYYKNTNYNGYFELQTNENSISKTFICR